MQGYAEELSEIVCDYESFDRDAYIFIPSSGIVAINRA